MNEQNLSFGEREVHEPMMPEKKDRFLAISILAAAVLIGGSVVFAAMYKGGGTGGGNGGDAVKGLVPTSTAAGVSPADMAKILALGSRDAILGNPGAPVTIIEYGDYQCPYCAQYYSTAQSQIEKNYITTNKAKMVFRNFAFLGQESLAAANAAECAEDQNKFWAYHNALYSAKLADFAAGGKEDDGFFVRSLFLNIAKKQGLDISTFTNCIDTNKDAALVDQETSDAQTVGVQSTPTTFVDGTLVTGSDGESAGGNTAVVLQAIANAVSGK